MPVSTIKDLKDALDLGLGIVTRIGDYKTKDWVTSIFADDIDGDGDVEVIVCSRDGRMHLLSTKSGEFQFRWKRIIGAKAWVGTAIACIPSKEDMASTRIIVGTRDGKVFVLDADGKTVSKTGETFPFDAAGWAIDRQREEEAYWYNTGYAIRQIAVDRQSSTILIGSEDRSAYGLDYETGELLWSFPANGWVRTVSSCDIDGDGGNEVLVGSTDRFLYLLDQQGKLLDQYLMNSPIYTCIATDVDGDGCIELLITTEDKDLTALVYHRNPWDTHGFFEKKWRKTFDNRILSFCVTDIDGDEKTEIIAGSEDKHIYILDAEGNTIWRHNHKYRVFTIYPYDIDRDGLPELLVGSEHKRVRSMHIRLSRGVEKKVRRYYRQLKEPVPAEIRALTTDQRTLLQDILMTKERELVTLKQGRALIAEGEHAQALAVLLKLEQQKVEQLWQKNTFGKVRSISLRHSASEQQQEIIVGTAEGTIHALQANGRHPWYTTISESNQIVDVQTGFINHHKQEEIVICSTDHRVYVLSGPKKPELHDTAIEDPWISSICVTASDRRSGAEIIIGSEDKRLSIYGSDLRSPVETIDIEEGVRIVRSHPSSEASELEIVAASLEYHIFAYTRHGKRLWMQKTRDRIKAMHVKDINNDGKIEILVGSEDRNIHVLDHTGHLLWRYYLPHSVLAIDTAEKDGRVDIFVGCADGYLYVFSKEGDLLWSYQAQDRIRALRAGDIDADGDIEIAIGAEDEFELLRVVNQRQVSSLIAQCWAALCQSTPARQAIATLLDSTDPFLQAFALYKLAEQADCTPDDFDILETFVNEGVPEVRKALVRVVMTLYPLNPGRARKLLAQLWADSEQDVRNALVEQIQVLINDDWEAGFDYLTRASDSFDRFGRRLVVRKLHQLIDASVERPVDKPREVFRLLLTAVQDSESEWVRQEAARTMAHFLNRHHGSLIVYMHLFIVKGVRLSILRHITHITTAPVVKHFLNAVIPMLEGPDEQNVTERLQQVVKALGAASNLIYGKDLLLIYTELYRLFTLETLAEIANYQCALKGDQFDPNNKFALIILDVFNRLSVISRPLKMYARRENIHDRLASLLETSEAINRVPAYIEQKYATSLMDEPIVSLPDRQVFTLLLEKWRKLVQAQLNELRGKAELTVELQTREVRYEEQVSIWLTVKNSGRSSASEVQITLLHNDHFEIVGHNSFETELILPQEETIVEFTLKPCCPLLNLELEITYDDSSNETKIELFEEQLELRNAYQEYRLIDNLYSTGIPMHDSKMFYGREKDMAFLRNNLTREARSVVVLYGQRRSGKTTVLVQLINSSTLGSAIPVLIDLQGVSYSMTIASFLHDVAYAIAEAMNRKDIIISSPALENFVSNPRHTFNLFLNVVEKHLTGRKLILLFDEFEVLEEQVAKRKVDSEIFEYLRDIVQHRQSINFLFAGTHKITEHTKWYRSVFFQIALHYPLSRLSAEGAEALIQKPVEGFLEYEPYAVQKIRQLTGDQPYLIHLICRAIVDYCNDREKTYVTINDVNTVLREVMQTGDFHFSWLWDQIKPDERITLAVIAEGGKEEGRWLSFLELADLYTRHNLFYKREYVLEALKKLIEADIIEQRQGDARKVTMDSNRFRIPVGLTRSWLLKEHPLEQVRIEMSD